MRDTSRLIKRSPKKLALDDIFYPSNGPIQQLIDHATTAKHFHGTKSGISFYAWVIGAHQRHPLIDSDSVPPVPNVRDVADPFVAHLQRKLKAAVRFIPDDAKSILRFAKKSRARRLIHIAPR